MRSRRFAAGHCSREDKGPSVAIVTSQSSIHIYCGRWEHWEHARREAAKRRSGLKENLYKPFYIFIYNFITFSFIITIQILKYQAMDNDEDEVFQSKPTNKADRVKGVIYCGDDYKKWLWNGSKYRQVCCKYGCTKQAQFCTDVCVIHGAVAIRCSVSMCESRVVRGGKCYKHGEATACVIDG